MAQLAIAPTLMAAPATFSPLAAVSVHASFEAAREPWVLIETQRLLTPYQHYDFLESWWRKVGRHDYDAPVIAVGTGTHGEPLFVWPFARRRQGLFTIAEPLGGKHASYHFGPWSAAMLEAGPEAMRDALKRFAVAAPTIDALVLSSLAVEWSGRANPFAALDATPSPSDAYSTRLQADPDAHMLRVMSHDARKQVRSKTRKLEALAGFRMYRATEGAEVDRLLAAFLAQKAERFASMGIVNPFAAQGVAEWLRDGARRGLQGGASELALYGLEAEGEILAVAGGLGDGRHFSCMFNSFAVESPHAKLTPVYVLTAYIVADLCRRGYQSFDLGVGEARYKGHFCDQTETLVDTCVPLTRAGSVYAAGRRNATRLKRYIKRSPFLWDKVQRLRRLRG